MTRLSLAFDSYDDSATKRGSPPTVGPGRSTKSRRAGSTDSSMHAAYRGSSASQNRTPVYSGRWQRNAQRPWIMPGSWETGPRRTSPEPSQSGRGVSGFGVATIGPTPITVRHSSPKPRRRLFSSLLWRTVDAVLRPDCAGYAPACAIPGSRPTPARQDARRRRVRRPPEQMVGR